MTMVSVYDHLILHRRRMTEAESREEKEAITSHPITEPTMQAKMSRRQSERTVHHLAVPS